LTLEHYISTYGYLAVFLGVFVEGEAIVLTAGFLAYQGILQLHWVILSALVGSICVYQGFFYLGRSHGNRFLDSRPHWKPRIAKIQVLLQRHYLWIIFGYRLFFGFRSITPFALGMTAISQKRFLAIDLLPATVWSVTFSVLGYLFGHVLEAMISNLEKYQYWIALGFFAGILLLVALYFLYQRRHRS